MLVQLSGYRLTLGNQRFPVQVLLLAMWRGEPIITHVNCECLWKKTQIEKKKKDLSKMSKNQK